MTKRLPHPWPIDHPEIVAIALDVMLVPSRRVHYSPLVLMLADAAIERIRRELAQAGPAQVQAPPAPAPAPAGPAPS
jgi:hypothetical protein